MLDTLPLGTGDPPSASAPDVQSDLSAEIAALAELDLHQLRVRWRKLFRTSAPSHLTRVLLLRIIAWRIQAKALGDLDRETQKYLAGIARQPAGRAAVPAVPDSRKGRLKPGTTLVREHGGTLHRVVVVADGFCWQGRSWRSLSEIARAITGTNWNGPAFFGLRGRTRISNIKGSSS